MTWNNHLRSSGERNGVQRKTKVSFGRTMMHALELAKRRVLKRSIVENEEIKPTVVLGYACLEALVS